MKTTKQAIESTIKALNEQHARFTSASQGELENIFEEAIKEAFESVEKSNHKALYHQLSRKFHSDKFHHAPEPFQRALSSRNFEGLPMTVLNGAWKKVQAANEETTPNPVSEEATYNPFSYFEAISKKFETINSKIILRAQSAEPDEPFDDIVKEQFPELYRYEQYSSIIRNIMYWTATGVNAAIALAFTVVAIETFIVAIVKFSIERPLLNYVTAGRYGQSAAKAPYLQQALGIDTTNLSDAEVDDAFDNAFCFTEESQRSFLEKSFISLGTRSEEAITLLFKKIWIKSVIQKLVDLTPELSKNESVEAARIKLAEIEFNTSPEELKELEAAFETMDVDEIYTTLRKAQRDVIDRGMEEVGSVMLHWGGKHLNMVFRALQETWAKDDLPVIKRIMQALVLLVTLPLMAAVFLLDMSITMFYVIMFLFKAASVALINAPLDIHTYFTKTETETETETETAMSVYAIEDARTDNSLVTSP